MTLVQIATSPEAMALYSLAIVGLEKKFQFIKPVVSYIKDHKGAATAVVAEGEKLAGEVLDTPKMVALEAKSKDLEQKVTQSEIFKAATAVVHNLDVKVEELSPETENAVALAISTQVSKLFGKTVTVTQVISVLDEMKKLAQKVASEPAVQAAKQLSAPTPALVQQEQTSPVGDGQAPATAVS